MLNIIMTHDIDWPRWGPGVDHILVRRSRFDEDVIVRVLRDGYNPYFGIPDLMDLEERFGVRSTFFFRPIYDDGSRVDQYWDVVWDLVRGGWEVGVHLNSVESFDDVLMGKRFVEGVVGSEVVGCRVHYLRIRRSDYWKLRKAGFRYDSSLKYFKDRVDVRDMGYEVVDGVVVFPVTVMDAYLFTYMGVSEEGVVKVVAEAIEKARRSGKSFITILWHDSSIHMKGGRAYVNILEYITSLDDVRIIRGVDAYRMVKNEISEE